MKRFAMITAVVLAVSVPAALRAELERPASWSVPSAAEVKAELDGWLANQTLTDVQKQEIDALWTAIGEDATGSELLDQVAATLAVASADAKAVVTHSRGPRAVGALPDFKILADESLPPVVRNNLRLIYGSWLAQ